MTRAELAAEMRWEIDMLVGDLRKFWEAEAALKNRQRRIAQLLDAVAATSPGEPK